MRAAARTVCVLACVAAPLRLWAAPDAAPDAAPAGTAAPPSPGSDATPPGSGATPPGSGATPPGSGATPPAAAPTVAPAPAPTVEPPRLVHTVAAAAPPLAPGQEAVVGVTLDVDAAGHVADARVSEPAGPPFDDAALAAARQFVFTPGRADGKPVPTEVTYRIRFHGPPLRRAPPPDEAALPLLGTVESRGERVPQPGITVIVDDNAAQAVSDARGRFRIDDLRRGAHVLHFRGIDIAPSDARVELRRDRPLVATFYVAVTPRYRSTVRAPSVIPEAVEQSISIEEVKHIPGTQGDTLKAVQNLPGVARPPFNGGLLVVWGSAPNDTRTYADGVFIPTLYHFGGLRSTVNSDIVQSLTFLPGGYGVEHGRGLGGVVEIESREPRTDGLHGFAQVDLIDVSAMLEGALTKSLSFAAGVRVSWLKLFLPAFVSGGVHASPQYWDYQLKLHWRASSRDGVDLFVFGSDDQLDLLLPDPNPALSQRFTHHTYYHRALVRWRHRFAGGSSLTVTPSVGYDVPYELGVTLGNAPFENANGQLEYSLRALWHVPVGKRLRLDAGLDYEGTRYTLDATQNLMGLLREGDTGGFSGYSGPDAGAAIATDHLVVYTNHTAPFVALTLALFDQRLLVTPQLRVDVMTFRAQSVGAPAVDSAALLPEPRLNVRFKVSSRVTLHGTIGVYHQPPDPPDLSAVFGNPKLSPEFGIHYVAGVEFEPTATLHVGVQGFYKDLRNLVVRGASPSEPPLENGGVGRVYGGELLVRQELWHNFFGWVSYTLSKSERRDHAGDPWRLFEYDQTHILTLLGSYKLPRGFQVGLRFRYVTGNPYTPVARAYYDVIHYTYVPIWGATYSARLPAFHQLDLRVDKTFTFDRWRLLVYLDVENVYYANSAEAVTFNYNFTQQSYVSGLPLLPVLGVRGEF